MRSIKISNIKKKKALLWPLLSLAILGFLFLLSWGGNFLLNKSYQGTFLKGTKAGGIDIGDLTFEEAKSKLDKRIEFVNRRGFVYVAPTKTVTIYPVAMATETGDSVRLIVSWDTVQTLENIQKEQADSRWRDFFRKLRIFAIGRNYPLVHRWDQEQHLALLKENFADVLTEKVEAGFEFVSANQIRIIEEKPGNSFDYEKALIQTRPLIEELDSFDIMLYSSQDYPAINSQAVGSLEPVILASSQAGDILLTSQDRQWSVANDTWRHWLKVKTKANGRDFYLGISQELFDAYLQEAGIKEKVEKPVQNARFKLLDGKVSEFINSQDGVSIDLSSSVSQLEELVISGQELALELTLSTVEPAVAVTDVNDLGIKEIIGTGISDFKGSPANRIHNIGVGASTLNGMLIAPGEEFSVVKALGKVDAEHGYKPELVIKGNQTIPEYGGGLCQVSTTIFRGALDTGLPITERRNHSYRVIYYEPAGTDATIYSPWPDLKFKNDTGHHILIQSRMEGSKLYFDFWGTGDGRIVRMTEPIVYNIVAPPPKKVIKTTDLAPGQEKCTEKAYNGASAKFDYSVQYFNKPEPVETTFYSHYVPWQEVCLLGVSEEELAESNNGNATSTPDNS
ncbi:MAG: VanW family protein [Patescibacteria group bacterium]|nr:VanW family protein [Patescibacteria group bacterium]